MTSKPLIDISLDFSVGFNLAGFSYFEQLWADSNGFPGDLCQQSNDHNLCLKNILYTLQFLQLTVLTGFIKTASDDHREMKTAPTKNQQNK